nr:C510 [uncultured bacterium]
MFHRHSAAGKFVGSVLGTIFASGYSALAHVQVHHIETDTADDTETPFRGENVYRFVVRAAYRQHRRSWQIEMTRLNRLGLSFWSPQNLILRGIGMYLLLLGGFYLATGVTGMLLLMLVSALGLFILEIFSYIQHYGLLREPGTPIEDRHAWNHLTPLGRALTFEIVTHSQHHVDPDRPYWRLTPRPNAPQMPSAVTCFVLALVPPLWERLIGRPLLEHWDTHHASARERELAVAANRAAGWPQWLVNGAMAAPA